MEVILGILAILGLGFLAFVWLVDHTDDEENNDGSPENKYG